MNKKLMKGIFKNSDYFNFSMKVWMLLLLIVILPVTSAGIGINFESPSSSTQTILFGNLTNLSQMGDVSIGSPTDTHVLTYNSSLGKWTSQASVGGITWADIVNGTMMSQATFNTNYTANNDAWLNTTNNTYDAYNSSGLIKDWNVDGYIKDWNSTGYIKNWNATGLIINWSQDLSSYITWANAINGTLFTTALYNTNYTANDAAYRNTTNNTYDAYNSTGLIQDWNSTGLIINWSTDLSAYATLAEILGFNYYNSTNAPIYVNDTFADNYTEFLTHIGWDEAVNGTLMLIVDWDTNYTANNDAWLNTTNNTYDAYNSSGLIKDWNASELIINWSTDLSAYATLAEILEFGYYNETDFNISDYYTSSQIDGFSYYNSTNAPIYINDTFAANYSDYLTKISWAEVVNGTVMLQSTWNTNYTANNDKWLNTTNNTYHAFNSSGLIKDWNATGLIINWSTDLSGYVPYTGANQNIVLGDNNFSVNSSTLFVDSDGGNVGIGTASPDSKLEVVGDIQITDTSPALKFVDSTVDADPFNIQVNSNRLEVFSGDLRNIINFMGESDANAGNVGIGTTSPSQKLDVNGSINISGTNAALIFPDGTNMTTKATGISWAEVINGTTMLQSTWNTNYTANNDKWLNTTNNTYHAYNSTGLIQDWNSSGLIINWSQDLSNYFNKTESIDTFVNISGDTMTGDLNMSANNINNISDIYFNLENCVTDGTSEGRVCWDSDKKTLSIDSGLGTVLQVGQEQTHSVKNKAGQTIYNGQVTYISGSSGEMETVDLADASNDSRMHNLGMVTQSSCNNNALCQITTIGLVHDIDTSAFSEGDSLYLTADGSGNITTTPPNFPNYNIHLGTVTRDHSTTGMVAFYPEIDWGDGVTIHSLGVLTNITVLGNITASNYFGAWNGSSLYLLKSEWNATNTSYYLDSNPYSFYNETDFNITDYYTSSQIDGFNYYNSTNAPIYVNDTFAANYSDYLGLFNWNETYANTLYAAYQFTDNNFNGSGNFTTTGKVNASDFIIPAMKGNNNYESLNDAFNLFTSAGRLSGGEIVADAGITVIVTEGEGVARIADDDVSQVKFIGWDNSSAITVPTDSIMYFGVDYNGGSPIVVNYSSDDNFDLDTSFPLGTVINQADEIYILNNPWWVGDGLTNVIERFQSEGWLVRDKERGGLILGYDGTRQPTMTAGTLWGRLTEHELPEFEGGDTFDMYYRDGEDWTEMSDLTQWNNTYYDNDGTLTIIGNNQYSVIWVWVNVASNKVSLMFPQATYSNAAAAEAETIPTTYPAMWYKGGVIIGRYIVKQGVDAPISTQSAFTTTFTAGLAADHGNLAGLADDDHPQYLLDSDWNTNYTANNDAWLNTTNNTYDDYNATGLIQDWNASGLIVNWSVDLSDYPTLAEILAFGYYNETDFNITDYYTSSQIDGFSYYNSTNAPIYINDTFADNYTEFLTHIGWDEAVNGTLMLASDWNATNTSYYLESNPYSYYNVTTAPIYINDTFAANYSTFLTHTTWANIINGTMLKASDWNATNTSYYLESNPYSYYNVTTAPVYVNDTFAVNYTEFLTHIGWDEAVNGTLALSTDIPTDNDELDNGRGYYNETDFNITDYYTSSQIDGFSYYNATNAPIYINDTFAANYSEFLTHIGWDEVINGTLMLASDWNATNTSYYLNPTTTLTVLGYLAGTGNTETDSSLFGYGAGVTNGGTTTTAIGYYAGYGNAGNNLVAVGHSAAQNNTVDRVTAVGYQSGQLNTGERGTFLGYNSGKDNTGIYSTGVGAFALNENDGDNVTSLGYAAGYDSTANNGVYIGYKAGYENAVDDQLIIKSEGANVDALITGDFGTGNIVVNENISATSFNGAWNGSDDYLTEANTTLNGNYSASDDFCIASGQCLSAVTAGGEPSWDGNSTLVAYTNIDETFDEDLLVTKNFTVQGNNITIGNSGSDTSIWFWYGGSGPVARIFFDDGEGRFKTNAGMYIADDLETASRLIAAADIYTTGSGDDLWLGTSTQGSALFRAYANGSLGLGNIVTTGNITAGEAFVGDGQYLTGITVDETDPHWTGNQSDVAFTNVDEVFDEDLLVAKNFTVQGNNISIGSSETDQSIWFYEDGSLSERIYWVTDGGDTFYITDSLQINGEFISSGSIESGGDIRTTGSSDDLWLGDSAQGSALFRAYANGSLGVVDIKATGAGIFAGDVKGNHGQFNSHLTTTGAGDNLWLGATTDANSNWIARADGSLEIADGAFNVSTTGILNTSANITTTAYVVGDGSFLTGVTAEETLWNANYSDFLTKIGWAEVVNGTLALASAIPTDNNQLLNGFGFYNATDFNISDYYTSSQIDGFSYYNSTNAPIYVNDTFAANYSDYLTKIGWAEVVNGTMMSQATFNTNYTANNNKWLNTTNNTYHAFNSSGLIKDWNATGYIKDWNSTGYIKNWDPNTYIKDWNSTGYIKNWDPNTYIKDWNSTGYITNWQVPINSANTTMASYVDGTFMPLGTNNFDQTLNTTSNVEFNNATITDCIIFDSGGKICSGS